MEKAAKEVTPEIIGEEMLPVRAHLAKGGRGRAADLTATLIAAWAYAGAGDGKKALETVDKLKGERAYAVFRDYHAGLIAETVGNQAEAEKRLKSAYEAERNTLRIVDAYARLQSRRGQKEAALQTYAAQNPAATASGPCCRATRSCATPSSS